MENLAPAGNREALERAVAAGADAVYLGYTSFGARAGANNFDRDGLEEAIRFAHLHHVRVHVTVNTLVKDRELGEVLEVLQLLRKLRADAILVQDLGVLMLARSCCPGLVVHASTQMGIHNRSGVKWCQRQGIKRAVLARECSMTEISLCAKEPIEIETFVHGAQCVAVSGLCLFSSMVGERSGNRGRCAQPCRLRYTFDGKNGAWLSPRDVCLRNALPELRKAGVCSLKIEGRLKRPEYVAVVTGSYRRALDELERGDFRPADEKEMTALRQIFQRGGFMNGYAMGCEDADVIFPEQVAHAGIPLGSVVGVETGFVRVLLERNLNDGDALQLQHGYQTEDLIYAGKPIYSGEVARIRLREGIRAGNGDRVVRLTDSNQLKEAQKMPIPVIPVSVSVRAIPGEMLSMIVSDGISVVTACGDTVEEARNRVTTPEEMERSLQRTGGTAFHVDTCLVETSHAFVPVSVLNAIRREAFRLMCEARTNAFARDTSGDGNVPDQGLPQRPLPRTVIVRTLMELPEGCRVVLYPEDFREVALRKTLQEAPEGIWLQIVPACEEETLQMLLRIVTEFRDKLGGVLLGSVGQLGVQWPVDFAAGPDIPVMNRLAAKLLLDEGCSFVTASPELTGDELKTLCAGNAPVLVPVYGRTQLMILHHCPARTFLGMKKGHRNCDMCDRNVPEALRGKYLKDQRGYVFPMERLRLPEGCLIRLMNAVVTDVRDLAEGFFRMEVFNPTDMDAGTTRGHWRRPID